MSEEVTGIPKEDRYWAMAAHLGPILLAACSFGMLSLGSFLVPLIIWLVKRDESAYIGEQAKEALNFQITVLCAGIISFILFFVVIGFFTMIAVAVCAIVFPIMAAVEVNKGKEYRYPLCLRLL